MNHTWHPNTFGLISGQKTAKTACCKRRPPQTLVPNLETTCPECQKTILAHMLEMQAIHLTVHDLRMAGLIPPSGDARHVSRVPGDVRRYAVI